MTGASAVVGKGVGFLNRSFPCGSVSGIPLRVHVLLPILLGAILLRDIFYAYPWQACVMDFLIFGPLLFGTVLVHELGHCFAAKRVTGGHVHHILLWPLGGLAFVGHAGRPQDDLKVAVAGPLTHIPMGLIWLLLWFAGSLGHLTTTNFFSAFARSAVYMNIVLFCFNLLVPVYPLDGGRVFVDILRVFDVSVYKTAVATLAVSTPLAILIIIFFIITKMYLQVAIGVWILLQNIYLFMCVKDGRVEEHPLFMVQENQPPQGDKDIMNVPMQKV